MEEALSASSNLYRCELSFSELSHLIEKTEFEFYSKTDPNITAKEFRHNLPHRRFMVVQEIKTAWDTVKNISNSIEVIVNENMTDKALIRMSNQQLDGYDYFLLETMEQHKITQLITDDGDYITVPGITIFTANKTIIGAARSNNKLIMRP